uniref:Uncharacterized protein n=1 Tax=Leptospirillum ferrodiazotrophum TaxID=412449 RepID=C6HZW0_9BACT|nr:MAG: hypothetical protein UBAL3_95450118 [Leptospirillum ferrodiazotrophum]
MIRKTIVRLNGNAGSADIIDRHSRHPRQHEGGEGEGRPSGSPWASSARRGLRSPVRRDGILPLPRQKPGRSRNPPIRGDPANVFC